MISDNHAQTYLPLIARMLNGEQIGDLISDQQVNPIIITNGKVVPISADTWKENPSTVINNISEPSTLVIPVCGPITKYDNCGYYGAQTYAKVTTAAADSNMVTGIFMVWDCAGGTADGSYDFAEAVAYAASKKTVVSFADGLMASAAYRIAARGTTIVAKPGSIIGSIGTQVEWMDYSERLAAMGAKRIKINATKSIHKNEDSDEAERGNPEPIRQQILDPLNELFIGEMRAARNLPEEALTGKVYDPNEALRLNMIDHIGTYDFALSLLDTFTDKPNTSTKKQQSMKIELGKSILAFLGMEAQPESLTADQIGKLEGLAGENLSMIDQLRQSQEALGAANAQLTALGAQLEAQTAQIATLEEKVVTLGAKPGDTATQVSKETDNFELPENTPDQVKTLIGHTHPKTNTKK
jgi:ClpP class serine protease